MSFEPIFQLVDRVRGYLMTEPQVVLLEFLVIWLVVYMIVRFMRGTRGARVIKGAIILVIGVTLVFQLLSQGDAFERLNFLYNHFVTFMALVLIIVFQPELRRALVRIGETRWFGQVGLRKAQLTEEVIGAVEYLARNKIGALIAIERQVGIRGIVETGTTLDAKVSRQLIQTIFWPGSALHDLGMVLRGDRIVAAGVQFPLAEGEYIDPELGSRHRAAMGLSQESDALVIVVSEETGTLSLAERGKLERGLSMDALRERIMQGLADTPMSDQDAPISTEKETLLDLSDTESSQTKPQAS